MCVVLSTNNNCRHGGIGSRLNHRGLSSKHIMMLVEESLCRMKNSYIDLYQVHSSDPLTPIEETIRTLDDLVRSGKVHYIGPSNITAWQALAFSR